MPSKKKARGKARREEKKKAKDNEAVSCKHDVTVRPTGIAASFVSDIIDLFVKYGRGDKIFVIIDDILCKYRDSVFEYTDRRNLCQQMLLSEGTALVLDQNSSNEKESASFHLCTLMACIHEVLGQHEGGKDKVCVGSVAKLQAFYHDMIRCPLELVRFFHKRNSCDCLKALYNNLKKTARRTALCHQCDKEPDVKDMMVCSGCKVFQYCSRACQIAGWPTHKGLCKHIKENKLSPAELFIPEY
eukprot:scaffold64434_cov52-Cyclotella_meneghiniana.AAC.6